MGIEEEVLDKLRDRFPKLLIEADEVRPGAIRIKIDGKDILEVCLFIKEELGFDHLSCISAVDWKDRFESVYHFTRYNDGTMLQLNTVISRENPKIESLCKLWKSANVHEREAYDMMGIVYEHHPNLKRILLPEDATIFPLRKDFPQQVDRQYISRKKARRGS